jgi:recombination protein RecA
LDAALCACRVAEFDVLFEGGINGAASLLDTAEDTGVVTRRGAYYYLGSDKLGQGKDNVVTAFKEDPQLMAKVQGLVEAALVAQQQQGQGSSGSRSRAATEQGQEIGEEWSEDSEAEETPANAVPAA